MNLVFSYGSKDDHDFYDRGYIFLGAGEDRGMGEVHVWAKPLTESLSDKKLPSQVPPPETYKEWPPLAYIIDILHGLPFNALRNASPITMNYVESIPKVCNGDPMVTPLEVKTMSVEAYSLKPIFDLILKYLKENRSWNPYKEAKEKHIIAKLKYERSVRKHESLVEDLLSIDMSLQPHQIKKILKSIQGKLKYSNLEYHKEAQSKYSRMRKWYVPAYAKKQIKRLVKERFNVEI